MVQRCSPVSFYFGDLIVKNPLIVLPHSRVSSNSEHFEPLDGVQALQKTHATDAHAVGYTYPDGTPTPRLKLGDLGRLIEDEKEPILNWVFVDVDNADHKRWTPDEAESHWATLKNKTALRRAGFYGTRGGYRLVFRLAQPVPVSVASHFIEQFYTHLRTEGVPVDPHCVERWNTLFRLPRVNRDGENLDAFVDLSNLAPLQWVAPLPLQKTVKPKTLSGKSQERPQLRTLTPLEWGIVDGCADALGNKYDKIRDGEPLASHGARQSTMFKCAAVMVGRLGLDDPDLVYQALAPSIVAGGRQGSKLTLDDLWDRCCYLVGIDQAKRKAREEIKERVQSEQPPIVYHGTSYYIHDTAGQTYRPPVPGAAVCQALEQWCKIPGLETRSRQQKPRGVPEFLADYGRQAVEVVVEMGREKSVYHSDVNGGTLIGGCCVPVDVEPEKNEEIAEWLKHFAGDYHEKLLDWIATVAILNHPTCALYIQGPPSTGKGLFASGMASLWGSGATSYADATGKFNGALTRSPIVLVDEMFQTFDGGDGFSANFRTLIGESTRQLRRKNIPSATLRGCPRLVILANNADALKLTENLGRDDLLAIAERILHIKHDTTPRDYIQFMGGRDFTAGWVLDEYGRPGAIARHAKYLANTRQVKTGGRFLVEGEIADWHRDLMGNSGIQGATLAALAHFIDRAKPVEGIKIEGRYIFVNVPALRGLWGLLMGDQPPREGTLAGALKTLAGGVQARKNFGSSRLRCYRIELFDVLRRAESLQIGDVERFENLLKRKESTNDQRPEA